MTQEQNLVEQMREATKKLRRAFLGRPVGRDPSTRVVIDCWDRECGFMLSCFQTAINKEYPMFTEEFAEHANEATDWFNELAEPDRGIITGLRAKVTGGRFGRNLLDPMETWVRGLMQMKAMAAEVNLDKLKEELSAIDHQASHIVDSLRAAMPESPETPGELILSAASYYKNVNDVRRANEGIEAIAERIKTSRGLLDTASEGSTHVPPIERLVALGTEHPEKFKKATGLTLPAWKEKHMRELLDEAESLRQDWEAFKSSWEARCRGELLRVAGGKDDIATIALTLPLSLASRSSKARRMQGAVSEGRSAMHGFCDASDRGTLIRAFENLWDTTRTFAEGFPRAFQLSTDVTEEDLLRTVERTAYIVKSFAGNSALGSLRTTQGDSSEAKTAEEHSNLILDALEAFQESCRSAMA